MNILHLTNTQRCLSNCYFSIDVAIVLQVAGWCYTVILLYRFIVLFFVPRVVPGTFLRMEQYQVHLGPEEEGQGHRGGHRDAHHQAGDLDLSRGSYSFTRDEREIPGERQS